LAASSRLARRSRPSKPRHGQSILEVLRTRPLTAPAPGSDRRLSGEARQVGGHSHRSDHEPQESVPGVQRWRPGARLGMHLRRERAHLHTCDLHRVHGQRRARCVPDDKVTGGESRSPADTPRLALTCGGPCEEAGRTIFASKGSVQLPQVSVAARWARIGRHHVSWCIQPVRGTLLKSAKAYH